MKDNYEMDIKAVFHLSRGTTAIVGNLKGYETKRIIGSKAQLFVDGKPQTTIELYETIFDRPTKDNLRSLETYDKVELTQNFVEKHNCRLVEVKN
ncbi:hypothetical protein [Myxosarcina sp. GI1]|uniref:hypothetical protein n=1 Tax=Myxosarcina sp. GI1 TaxID=1541065 RepID=UPI0005603B3F|nr:hypothetical protein [Myxosarcina sp. GI1]